MTRIKVFRYPDKIVGFIAEGHSGYAASGRDIICSAVSAVTQATLMGLISLLDINLKYEIKEAWIDCRLQESNSEKVEKAQILLKTMALALQDIAEQYPENVQYNEVWLKYKNGGVEK